MINSNKGFKDERIMMQRQKIYSNAFSLVFFMLIASLLIKSVIMDLPFKSYISEFIIFMGGSLYILIHTIMNGSFEMQSKGKKASKDMLKTMCFSAIGGVIFSIVIGVRNLLAYKFDPKMLPGIMIPLFIEYTLITFAMVWVFSKISNKVTEKQLRELEEENEE